MNVDECKAWLAAAEPGDEIEYHRGHLATDRLAAGLQVGEIERARRVREVARLALELASMGAVELCQRRPPHDASGTEFSYLLRVRVPYRLAVGGGRHAAEPDARDQGPGTKKTGDGSPLMPDPGSLDSKDDRFGPELAALGER